MNRATRGLGAALLVALLACLAAPAPGRALVLDPQLREIGALVRERRYRLAIESLRLVVRQIQDLRLEQVAPAFPAAPAGWTALAPISLVGEDETWTDRLLAQRAYVATAATARMDLTIDVNTPLGPAAALLFNPLALNADPGARIVEVAGEKGLLRHNPDTGEAEVRVLLGRDILVTARARGIESAATVVDLVRGVDFALLRARSGI